MDVYCTVLRVAHIIPHHYTYWVLCWRRAHAGDAPSAPPRTSMAKALCQVPGICYYPFASWEVYFSLQLRTRTVSLPLAAIYALGI
jgi:hypothetical protein